MPIYKSTAQNLAKKPRRGILGKFPSLKMKQMIAYESLVECDYIYLLDFDPLVTSFKEQPLTIPYETKYRYTPDFQVVRGKCRYLVECKPRIYVDSEENQRKFKAANEWCAANGFIFQVVTEIEMRHGYRLENIKRLTSYARYPVSPEIKGKIFAFLMQARTVTTVADLIRMLAPTPLALAITAILNMVYHHKIYISLDDGPISTESQVGLSTSSMMI